MLVVPTSDSRRNKLGMARVAGMTGASFTEVTLKKAVAVTTPWRGSLKKGTRRDPNAGVASARAGVHKAYL